MPRIYCTFCEHEWDAPVDDIWSCPGCEMGAPPTAVLDYSASELDESLARIHTAQLERPFLDRSRVFYATYGAPRATDYDLLAILFDEVFISEGWVGTLSSQDRDRLQAYIGAGIVKPICLDSFVENSPTLLGEMKTQWHVVHLKELIGFTQSFPGATASWFLNNIAQMISCSDFKTVDHGLAWERFSALNKDSGPSFFPHAIAHLMNRLNGHGIVASCLGVSMIADPVMTNVWKIKLSSLVERSKIRDKTLNALGAWYSKRVVSVGSRLPVQEILRFRKDDDARNRFIEFLRSPLCNGGEQSDEYKKLLQDRLDSAIASYNRAFGEREQFKNVLLSGLLQTLGGVIGGTPGAVLGGMGAEVGTFFVRKQYLGSLEPWACYFARWTEPQSNV